MDTAALRARIEEHVRRRDLLLPGGDVLCLVSGGTDSTCLWHALGELGYRVSALHVNHGLRGEESDEDARHCAERLGAEVVDTITAGDTIIHSDLRLVSPAGTSTFTVAEAFPPDSVAPEAGAPTHASFTIPVEDADAAYARAISAGGSSIAEPADWFEGFRQAAVRDPFGHRWFFVTVADSVTAADVQRASDAWMAEQA